MLKKDLLEILKDINEDAEINETLQGIEELKKPFTLEDFKNQLEVNSEIKGYFQSSLDSGIGKGIASFKEKTLPKILEEEIKKANNKSKTPEQIELEELKAKFEQLEKDKARAEMSTKYSKILNDKGLNADLLQFVLGADEETTDKNIETLSNIINSNVSNMVKDKITENPPIPEVGQGGRELSGVEKAFYSRNPNLLND